MYLPYSTMNHNLPAYQSTSLSMGHQLVKTGLWPSKMEKTGWRERCEVAKVGIEPEKARKKGVNPLKTRPLANWHLVQPWLCSAASDTAETKQWFCTRHQGNKFSRFGSPKHQLNSVNLKSPYWLNRYPSLKDFGKVHRGDLGYLNLEAIAICTEPPARKRWLLHSGVDCFLRWANLCSFCEAFEGSGSCLRALPATVWGEKAPNREFGARNQSCICRHWYFTSKSIASGTGGRSAHWAPRISAQKGASAACRLWIFCAMCDFCKINMDLWIYHVISIKSYNFM